jgi:hypothetical protein
MSKSPFRGQSNALFVFNVATGGYTEDEATGNPIERKTTYEIRASISPPDDRSRVNQMPGPDQELVLLEGYTTDPKWLPDWVDTGSVARLTLTDLHSGKAQSGSFTFTSIQQSQFKQVVRALGSRFEGTFRLDRVGEVNHAG